MVNSIRQLRNRSTEDETQAPTASTLPYAAYPVYRAASAERLAWPLRRAAAAARAG